MLRALKAPAKRALDVPVKTLARSTRLRRATSPARLLPAFLIAGGHPPDTTALFRAVCRHPHAARPTARREAPWSWKELHYFDDKFERGLGWYRSFFPLAVKQRLARRRGGDLVPCESTPSYLSHPAVPERVATTLPTVRIVFCLRDPVERAYAHWATTRLKGLEELEFEEALAAEEERLAGEMERMLAEPGFTGEGYRHYAYASRGLYAEQLERWFAHVPKERILVLMSEDFTRRPAEVYAEMLAFLGLPSVAPAEDVLASDFTPAQLDDALRARVAERFAGANARLADVLGRDPGWSSSSVPQAVSSLPTGDR